MIVKGIVHHVAGEGAGIRAESAFAIDAMEMELVLRGTVAVRGVERRGRTTDSVPSAACTALRLAIPDLLHELPGLIVSVGADLAPDPDAGVDRSLPQALGTAPANQLQCAHHARGAFELLPGQQAQGVTQ